MGKVAPPDKFSSQMINVEMKKTPIFLKYAFYSTKDGLLRDNFSRTYHGDTRITASTLLPLQMPYTVSSLPK